MFSKFIFKNTYEEQNIKEWDATYFENLFVWGELNDWTFAYKQLEKIGLSNYHKKHIKFAIKTTEQQGLIVPFYFKQLVSF
jgi:hypothetical protein